MTTDAFISSDDLKNALGPATFTAIFDDTNAGPGSENATAIAQIIRRAHSRVLSRLPNAYATLPAPLPAEVPGLLEDAELDYAVAYAWQRHPEYVKTYGGKGYSESYDRAEKTMTNVADSIQRLADVTTVPGNVGGATYDSGQRIMIDSPDGTNNGGDF